MRLKERRIWADRKDVLLTGLYLKTKLRYFFNLNATRIINKEKERAMFRDFLVGTFGKFLQVLFLLAGLALLLGGIFGSSTPGVIIGVVLLCMSFGIRYALGGIFRVR
ncbi:hypothetical protein ACFLVJ_00565 [Chloroflexota bacterium]